MFNTKSLASTELFTSQDRQQMTVEQTKTLIDLAYLDTRENSQLVENDPDFRKLGTYQMFWSRASFYFGPRMPSPALWLWLTSLANSPGSFLLLLAIVHANCKTVERTTLRDAAEGPFAYGVPTPALLSVLWDMQKSDTGANLLDNPAAWTDAGVTE